MAYLKKLILPIYLWMYRLMMKICWNIFIHFPIDHKKIVYSNFNGGCYGGNTKYIAQEFLKRGLDWKYYWVAASDYDLPKEIRPVRPNTPAFAWHMATAGVWVDNTPDNVIVLGASEYHYTYDVTLTDGFVTGVTLTGTVSDDQSVFLSSTQAEVTLLAFAAAQKGFDVKEMDDWASETARESWNYEFTRDGICATLSTEMENVDFSEIFGGDVTYAPFLPAAEGKTAEVTQVFTVTLEETP